MMSSAGLEADTKESGDSEIHTMPGHLIRRMHQASTAIFDIEMRRAGFDLTPVQYAALHVIGRRPGLDQATLAAEIAYDRVTIGGVVDRLEQKGLLRREIDREDRRSRRLHLEAKGADLLQAVGPSVYRIQDEMLQGLSADERQSLLGLLRKALSTVGDVSRTAPRSGASSR